MLKTVQFNRKSSQNKSSRSKIYTASTIMGWFTSLVSDIPTYTKTIITKRNAN